MFPGHTYQNHYTVTENGSLTIKGAVRKDEGHYVCSAISQAGASTATVFLQVCVNLIKCTSHAIIQPRSKQLISFSEKFFCIYMSIFNKRIGLATK